MTLDGWEPRNADIPYHLTYEEHEEAQRARGVLDEKAHPSPFPLPVPEERLPVTDDVTSASSVYTSGAREVALPEPLTSKELVERVLDAEIRLLAEGPPQPWDDLHREWTVHVGPRDFAALALEAREWGGYTSDTGWTVRGFPLKRDVTLPSTGKRIVFRREIEA